MKNYNEMANDVFRRIGEYETAERNKRKIMKKTILPICCLCLVALLGIGLWQGDFFNSKPPIDINDSTNIGEKDWIDDKDGSGNNDIDGDWSPNGQEAPPSNSNDSATSQTTQSGEVISLVKVNNVSYVPLSSNTTTKTYTPNTYLGSVSDFEGVFHLENTSAELYTTVEDAGILIVKLENGDILLLKRQD